MGDGHAAIQGKLSPDVEPELGRQVILPRQLSITHSHRPSQGGVHGVAQGFPDDFNVFQTVVKLSGPATQVVPTSASAHKTVVFRPSTVPVSESGSGSGVVVNSDREEEFVY
ncbi:hypothetical protein AURDEDRAFT_165908 [Auricularia subglabra TFB-10046 SS5]|nr:hypothetical protein AURDEDRAFT_165908 [Auricularia subglabra TFB-10046 SS5]